MSGIMLNFAGVSAGSKPGAPTIGTATATGSTTATVSYTAPANDGGSVITSYTATSSPGGITGTLSQAGSGTITVSGLSGSTSYTFTVTATNAIGTSAASAASNSITTLPIIGSAYGGGFFAGQISTAGDGIANYNLVIGPVASAENASKQFKTTNTSTTGTKSVIDGPTNSANMNNASHPAAQFCEGLTIGGYSDWYMPATNEIEVCYYNLKPTTTSNLTNVGINANAVPARTSNYTAGTPAQTSATDFQSTGAEDFAAAFYWSSTQNSVAPLYKVIQQGFDDGNQQLADADDSRRVRAVRRVEIFPPLIIGEAYQGGFFAGKISTSGNGVADYNLVVGPLSSGQTQNQWKNVQTSCPGADSVVDGPQNTADMVVNGNATVYPCAHFCNNAVIGGYTDWYMPAQNELEIFYYNFKPTTTGNSTLYGTNPNAVPSRGNYTDGTPAQTSVTIFQAGGSEAFSAAQYWSSTESTSGPSYSARARSQHFNFSGQYNYNKDNSARVRVIRRVPV